MYEYIYIYIYVYIIYITYIYIYIYLLVNLFIYMDMYHRNGFVTTYGHKNQTSNKCYTARSA